MIDFSEIGKTGMIIQFEDIVSMIGFNIVRYFKLKGLDVLKDKDLGDLILSYVNRECESYDEWVTKVTGKEIRIESYIDSVNAFHPSWLYVYKVFSAAYKNGIKTLMIHSDIEIPFIQKHLLSTFNIPSVKYVYGDIVPILNQHPNITYLTASPKNIERCLDVTTPFALTICDDFIYTNEIIVKNIPERLKEQGKFVAYTSIFSSGFIDD